MNIYIAEKVLKNIQTKNLSKQYEKAELYLKEKRFREIDFKIRQPKNRGIYYFRLNQQFRLWCRYVGDDIHIFHLDNHQN